MLPSNSIVKVIHFCLYASFSLYNCEAMEDLPKNHSILALQCFGDSFLDTGNNNYITTVAKVNFPPYGKDFMGGIPTGRWTNGKTIGDFVVEKLGVKDYIPAYLDPSIQDNDLLTGVSFASGVTGYDPKTSEIASVISLSAQMDMFKEYIGKLNRIVGDKAAKEIIGKSLYMLSSSSNDWAVSYTAVPVRALQYDVSGYANLLANIARNFIEDLYKLGARRIVVWGTPYIGCWPLARTASGGLERICGDKFDEEAQIFNSLLKRQIQSLGSSLPQSKICYVDYYNIAREIIENPEKFGFKNVDRGCCGTGLVEVSILCNKDIPICPDDSKFLFWDSVHLTERGYNIVVNHALPDLMSCML